MNLSQLKLKAFEVGQKLKNNGNFQSYTCQNLGPKFTNKNQQVCKHCYIKKYTNKKYWYFYSKFDKKEFLEKYLTNNVYKTVL